MQAFIYAYIAYTCVYIQYNIHIQLFLYAFVCILYLNHNIHPSLGVFKMETERKTENL